MKTQTVSIVKRDNTDRIDVQAIIVGPLAVYRRVDIDGAEQNDWVVGHVATGWRVSTAIHSRARAIRVANALQFLDWDFTDPKDPKVAAMAEKVAWAINLTT